MVHHGDLFDVLPTLAADSLDACVTDPPYDLTANKRGGSGVASINLESPYGRARIGTGNGGGGFMGKAWDGTGVAFSAETWAAVMRVLKPGAHLLAFGGTRTFHRMTCAIEDAGFEIRDCLCWLYGQGFPKSLNLPGGLGTALKPAWEPIILARKPTAGTVAGNVAAHGTGALNIDACRIAFYPAEDLGDPGRFASVRTDAGTWRADDGGMYDAGRRGGWSNGAPEGRWPANVLLDEDAAVALDEASGPVGSNSGTPTRADGTRNAEGIYSPGDVGTTQSWEKRGGGASRFFYVAKPSREERDFGCNGIAARTGGEATDREDGTAGLNSPRAGAGRNGGSRNVHPTVKPIALMRYLVKLVTPPGGTVLDPFTGSGTTGMACRYEDRQFIGIEREAEYVAIALARIAAVAPLFGEVKA